MKLDVRTAPDFVTNDNRWLTARKHTHDRDGFFRGDRYNVFFYQCGRLRKRRAGSGVLGRLATAATLT
jgi:hypothetical protein